MKSTKNVKEVTAQVDDAYQDMVQTAVRLSADYEHTTLRWYWEMGALFSRFLDGETSGKLGGRTVDNFVNDIRESGFEIEIGKATLYAAKQIHDRYPVEHLGTLIEAGVRVGHLKLLMPLTQEARTRAEKKLIDKDGKARLTIRQLEDVINDQKRNDAQASAARIDAPKDSKSAPAASGDDEELFGDGDAPTTTTNGDDPLTLNTPAKGEHRTANPKEFSEAPLPVLKRFGKAANSATVAAEKAAQIAAEAIKVGFDGDRARQNFLEELQRVIGDAATLHLALVKVTEQFEATLRDVASTLDAERPQQFKPKRKR